MANNDGLVNMAQQFTGLPMQALIGGPLMAACEANSQMALTQAKYIMDVGFEKNTTGTGASATSTFTPVMIDVEFERSLVTESVDDKGNVTGVSTDGGPEKIKVKMPLISILPIPALAVSEVDISFDMDVKSSTYSKASSSNTEKAEMSGGFDAKVGYLWWSVNIHGSASASYNRTASTESGSQASNEAHYHVEVKAAQQAIPQGLQELMKAFAKNIAPIVITTDGTPPKPPTPPDHAAVPDAAVARSPGALVGTVRLQPE